MEYGEYLNRFAIGYFYGVFYEVNDHEWNFLAAFDSKEKAIEYANRNVWKERYKMRVSKQPVF